MADEWWRRAVFYQIYPRSFADSDGDGIGDLPGITGRLGHLRGTDGALGVDAIWLSPFYPSPMVDFGYDISDFCDVDPVFGTLADFADLLATAHRLGLRVLVDLVPNHTSDQHPWFAEARCSRKAARRLWYVWADPGRGGGPPNNWLSSFASTGSAWTLDDRTGQYYLHSYTRHQPDLNWWNPQVRAAFAEVMRFWLDLGVDGFRIDAPHRLIKDPQLRDNPPEVARLRRALTPATARHRNIDHPAVHEVMRLVRRVLDEYRDRVAVGEVGVVDMDRLARYHGEGDELHLVFNFAFWSQPWSAARFRNVVADVETTLPDAAWPTYAMSNHDLPRVASRHDGGGYWQPRARVAAMMLLTLRGTPFLYYGDEIGMTDILVPAGAGDPDGRDGCRSPMQWDDTAQSGFTTGPPWLPVALSADRINVAAQRADPASLLTLYRNLLDLRRAHRALTAGDYQPAGDDDRVFAYHRRALHDHLLIALNVTADPVALRTPGTPASGHCLLSTAPSRPPGPIALDPARLAPHEGVVIQLRAT